MQMDEESMWMIEADTDGTKIASLWWSKVTRGFSLLLWWVLRLDELRRRWTKRACG
jgi:hypothetical protein